MNSLQVSLVVLGLVVVLGTYSGEAVKCYVCNSNERYEGDECTDDVKLEKYLVDCAEYGQKNGLPELMNATLCRKQVQTVQGDNRVVRSCAIKGRTDRCVDRTGTKAVKVTYCECEGDGCNTASGVLASVITVSVAALLSRAFH